MKYLLIILFPIICFADSQDELIETIQIRCDFFNDKIPFDIREQCMLDYTNCGVKLGGTIDIKEIDKCVSKRREKQDEYNF